MARILVVEDEVEIMNVIANYLRRDGHEVLCASSGEQALQLAREGVDLVVLDVMIPKPDGLEVTRVLRTTSPVPILIVSARGEEADRVAGLELGADDYLTKPFAPREMLARVKALLRRSQMPSMKSIDNRRLMIDPESRRVKVDGEFVELTGREYDILKAMASVPSRGAALTRDSLYQVGSAAQTLEQLRAAVAAAKPPEEVQIALRYPDGRLFLLSGKQRTGRTQSFLESIPLERGELAGTTLEVRAFRPKPTPGRPGSFWYPLRDFSIALSLAGLACFAIAVALSDFVSEPVARLADAVDEFEGRAPETPLKTQGPPEIKELAEAFNQMALRLSTSMHQLRMQKDEAERSETSRREFLGEVSHNLRTPLAAILGWTETLLDDLDRGNERAYLKRIRRETRYVATTLERLLDLSRWERARPMLHLESFLLTDVLLETAENLEEAAAERQVELQLELPEEQCWVEADRHRVRDLFQILLENVVQHAGEEVTVKVTVLRLADRYQVQVSDNGIGLPESLRSNWRGDPVFSDTGRASLGLAIAFHLARAHNGELTLGPGIDSVGTTATFSLPFSSPRP